MGDDVNARNIGRILPNVRSRERQRRRIAGAYVAILGMVFLSTAVAIGSPAYAESPADTVELSDSEINSSLDALSKLFASAVTDEEFRYTIHDSVAERFDGDTDVLWDALAEKPGARSTLAKVAARQKGITTLSAQQAVDQLADEIPRFQIAVPENFDAWNPADYTPLVAYMPEGVEDTTLKTITAYDAAGQSFQLDAQVAPTQPVIVLGLNERTDDSGNLLKSQQATPSQQVSSGSETSTNAATSAAAAATYEVRVTLVHLVHDMEPWAKGDAEISMKAKSRGCSGTEYQDSNWAYLNNDGDWWGDDEDRVVGSTSCDVVFYWWEDDGGGADFTLGYGGFSLGVKMDDGDDLIGGIQLAHSKFQGASGDHSAWSNLTMNTD
jgi:Protein of unknown function (DUF3103)